MTATGSIALPGGKKIVLTKSSKTLSAASPLKLVLVVPKKSRAALKALFTTGKTATATITLTTANGLSFKTTIKVAIGPAGGRTRLPGWAADDDDPRRDGPLVARTVE